MPQVLGTNPEPADFGLLVDIFTRLLNSFVVLAGVVLFVMLLSGGLGYLTSGGDPEKVKKAGGTLTWAISGFVILLLSWFVLRFIKEFTGVEVTKFQLPGV